MWVFFWGMNMAISDFCMELHNAEQLSLEEYGILIRLLRWYSHYEIRITNKDIERFAKNWGVETAKIMNIINLFFLRIKGGWIHKQIHEEIKNKNKLALEQQKSNVQTQPRINKKDVKEIKNYLRLGASYGGLARRYGVTPMCIERIDNNETWRTV